MTIPLKVQTFFVKNKQFLLLNKNYASYENQTIGNECGIFSRIIITQFHNLNINANIGERPKINESQIAITVACPLWLSWSDYCLSVSIWGQ